VGRDPGSSRLTVATRLVLASGSSRRLELLRTVGLDPVVDAPDVDEAVVPGESAVDYVARVARDKCAVVAARHTGPNAVVVAADTTVALAGEILGKPADDAEAAAMLTRLAGCTHQVHTAVVVCSGGLTLTELVTTDVTFGELGADEIAWYVALGESFDKAGAYGVQSAAGALVERIDGSPSNVIGLPLRETLALIRRVSPSCS
jgi:septum formation protein